MFKSRSSETVRLVDLIDEAVERAAAVLAEKAEDLDEVTRADVARMVGIGAIKYADLSSDRVKDYMFDLERMVAFDGNTAGYLQYAHARVRSIFRKAGDEGPGSISVETAEERTLVLALLGFGSALGMVEATLEPHKLCTYLYALAMAFTSFYEKCPILKSEGAVRASRLGLANLTAKSLAKGLELLGISVPDKM